MVAAWLEPTYYIPVEPRAGQDGGLAGWLALSPCAWQARHVADMAHR
ncbi:MAG: hypothetical protein KIS84_00310 [Dokdonella sp.]|nr:hypothetical protein [Dokdonella sp.]